MSVEQLETEEKIAVVKHVDVVLDSLRIRQLGPCRFAVEVNGKPLEKCTDVELTLTLGVGKLPRLITKQLLMPRRKTLDDLPLIKLRRMFCDTQEVEPDGPAAKSISDAIARRIEGTTEEPPGETKTPTETKSS